MWQKSHQVQENPYPAMARACRYADTNQNGGAYADAYADINQHTAAYTYRYADINQHTAAYIYRYADTDAHPDARCDANSTHQDVCAGNPDGHFHDHVDDQSDTFASADPVPYGSLAACSGTPGAT